LPAGIVSLSEPVSERSIFITVITGGSLFLLLVPYLLLVADFARSWKSANQDHSSFKALGNGFRLASSGFNSSYPMMLILVMAQIIFGFIIILILPGWKPGTNGGVFLLLIISQLMFFIRLMLKTWRFASVTSMMEALSVKDESLKTSKIMPSAETGQIENLTPNKSQTEENGEE
jgi:hypothetical protein